MLPLPIDPLLPAVVAALRERGAAVLHAPTGAGKTTRLPRALLDAGLDGQIVLLEPRRVAARAAAMRMADELGEPVGQTIGYQVRFERVASAATRVMVVTEGVLLQRLVGDPFLEGVGAVLFDELHERSLDADLALAITQQVRQLRPELKVAAMSATLDVDVVAAFLDAPVLRSEGRSFPVEVRYLPRPDDRHLEVRVAEHTAALLAETTGDVLVFLPGAGEIARAADALAALRPGDVELLPMHGRLDPADQDRVLRPTGRRRRVILATNVAETSLTIPGVTAVVDAGLVRVLRHDPRRGLDRLVIEPNSRASADQRAGRAGRTAPGVCLRLWTELQHRTRPAHDTPEIRRVDLAGPALALLAWGEPDPRRFAWLEAPPPHALDAAMDLLDLLGATQGGRLTDMGRAMASLPAHPRIARLLVEGHRAGVLDRVAKVAALLEERQPMVREAPVQRPSTSDVLDQLAALDGERGTGWRPRHPGVAQAVRTAARQLTERTRRALGREPRSGSETDLLRALALAWPDRVAARRPDGRVVMANGRGAVLGPDTAVREAQVIVALDVVDTDDTDARVFLASGVDPAWLPTELVATARFDEAQDRVFTAMEQRFGGLVLERRLGAQVPASVVEAALVAGARDRLERARPDGPDLPRLVARIAWVARARPDLGLPPVDRAGLGDLLPDLVAGCRTLADLRKTDWVGALRARLSWSQAQQVDELAPERLTVPSGSSIFIDYPEQGPPVLAVRMQELFGCTETPRICGEPVMLHLLSPNGRPQQVTQDLAGFWTRTWPEVRKELRARYPKHSWPDDPRLAPAERRPRRPVG
jgi:ATP-dependent helicase HrpB